MLKMNPANKKILITGSNGRIGKILSNSLQDYKLSLTDLPRVDVRNYKELLRECKSVGAIIHLAWNSKTENFANGKIDPDNSLMFTNVYKAALESKIRRVIMASSVHADDFRNFNGKSLLFPYKVPSPTSPYGADKVFMESLGRYFSKKGLEVVCIRFGAVGYGKPKDKEGKILWLTNNDCEGLIKKIIRARTIPDNFSIVYGVSNNKNKIHSSANPFGWKPKEGYR